MNEQTISAAIEGLEQSIPAARLDRSAGTPVVETATAPSMSRKELDLIGQALSGDREAFYQLVKPYERAVYSAAIGVVGSSTDADDCAQEAFLKALKYLHTFRMDCRFSTWLVQIAINEGRMRLRRTRRPMESLDERHHADEGEGLIREIADSGLNPHQSLEQKELRTALQRAILNLPAIYREVFVLRDVDQLSIVETAETLNISEASVKTRLRRARMKMQEQLQHLYSN